MTSIRSFRERNVGTETARCGMWMMCTELRVGPSPARDTTEDIKIKQELCAAQYKVIPA